MFAGRGQNAAVRVVGRDAELSTIDAFLTEGQGALMIAGELGAGKTVVWEQGVAWARDRGWSVLPARPVPIESSLGFAALADLLDGVGAAVIDELPAPQRRALRIALLHEEADDEPPPARAVATATLNVLRALAAAGPVLIAIDDIPCLDRPTARVLSFAVRRVGPAPVRLLATARTGPVDEPPPLVTDGLARDRVTELRLGPLRKADIRSLLMDRLGGRPPPALVNRVYAMSGGNPYLAVELGRAWSAEGAGRRARPDAAGMELPVPLALRRLVQDRIDTLGAPVRAALLTAALAPTEPIDVIVKAHSGGRGPALARLQAAATAGVIGLDTGRVVFTHPLLRSVIVDDSTPADRRAAHRRLAGCASTPMERAAHLARSRARPDAAVAAQLDAAADQAYGRGLAYAAAELAELAVAATPRSDPVARRERRLAAAEYRFAAGDVESAFHAVQEVVDAMPPGPARARALDRLAVYQRYRGEPLDRWRATLERALAEAPDDDPQLRLRLHYGLGVATMNAGEVAAAAAQVGPVVALAAQCADPVATTRAATAQLMVHFCRGGGIRDDLLRIALAPAGRVARLEPENRPSYTAAVVLTLAGDLARARELLVCDHAEATDRGDEAGVPLLLWPLTLIETWTGDWSRAARLAAQGLEAAALSDVDVGLAFMSAARSHLLAGQGEVEAALADAATAETVGARLGIFLPRVLGAWGGAVAALSAGDAPTAHRLLGPLTEQMLADGIPEPGLVPFVPDEVEARVRLGDLDTARTFLDMFTDRAEALGRDRARAVAARARGLLLAAQGRLDAAVAELDRAVRVGADLGLPLEQARTLLVCGEVHRRARDRRRARHRLSQARAILARLGARQWLAACDAELSRYRPASRSGPPEPDGLTATERRVAELAAQGRTTKQIADAVFASTRTVETHLQRVYRKLHVRSRVELAHWLASRRG